MECIAFDLLKTLVVVLTLYHILRHEVTISYLGIGILQLIMVNSPLLNALASALIFLLITLKFISMVFCTPFALLCGGFVKIIQKFGKIKALGNESLHPTPHKIGKETSTTGDVFDADIKWILGDHCFKNIVPRCLRECIVFPVLRNICPQMRECVLVRLATFVQVRPEEFRLNTPYLSELAAAGFFYDKTSSSVRCCRCTGQFKMKKVPEKREEWHVPWCHFYQPAQVETIMPSPDLGVSRTTFIQETSNISEDSDLREPDQINSAPRTADLSQAHVAGSNQLIQRHGLGGRVQSNRPVPSVQSNNLGPPVQPASRGQPQQQTVTSNNPKKVYKTFEAREESIGDKEWAVGPNTPHALAMNGLYYGGVSDRLCCFSCKFLITGWYEPGRLVDVKREHAKYSPLCGSVRHRPSPE
ncbi:unnamed protein product [Lymnaea stagnalis]|uniref:Uncharacterized protein n=1 Tax=Lymnaea stagnalis TaxID=6523 RepID=A0AAV2IFP0_LYMST